MKISENFKLIGISMLFVVGLVGLAACGKVSGKQPTSGTWTCDNASQNYRPWQIWTFSSDGRYTWDLVGIKGTGRYAWLPVDPSVSDLPRLTVTDDENPKLNQTWFIVKADDSGWLMGNGRFEVYCHH